MFRHHSQFGFLIRLYVLILVSFCLFFSSQLQAHGLTTALSRIPQEDQLELEHLFRKLFLNDHFAYTLFGSKAVSLTSVPHEVELSKLLSGSRQGRLFWKKWGIWEHYQSLFTMPNFLLKKEESKIVKGSGMVIFVNKRIFKETVDRHLDVFQEVLGAVTSDGLLKELETPNSSLQTLLKDNEMLIGILLGYGEQNCRTYERRNQLRRLEKARSHVMNNTTSSFDTEVEQLNRSLQPINHQEFILRVNPVSFSADPMDSDTRTLIEKYTHLNKAISIFYGQGDVLDKTLFLLTE